MSTTHTVIGEHDVVVLLDAVDGWPAGTKGTVVSDNLNYKLVEISNDLGEALDFISLPPEQLRLTWRCRRPKL